MDAAHPVPQNITSFEFHLIGDMTLRQFLYLAVGLVIAYLSFIFLVPHIPYLAWPITVISSICGVALAFLPINDRPLDHWVKAFFKAVYSPTKMKWAKNGKGDIENGLFNQRLNIYLSSVTPPQPLTSAPIVPPTQRVAPPPFVTQALPPQPAPKPVNQQVQNLPSAEELNKTVELAHKAQGLQVKIIETERELSQIKSSAAAGANSQEYTKQFNTVFENLQKLVNEANGIKKQLSVITNEPEKPVAQMKVEVVAPSRPKQTQLTLTSFPNVINGIALDEQGNYLEGAVVVIHDKDGLPVRALKTNKLGQFTGSTPLPNGSYTVELEKDSLVFDILKIELDGKVLPPLNIAAKKIAATS